MATDVRKLTEDARRIIETAMGNLSPSGAREMARSIKDQAQGYAGKGPSEVAGQAAGQVREIAQQLLEWSQQNRERVLDLIQREVRRQLKAIGVATSDDLDTLRKRVRDLEKAGAAAPAKRSSAKPRAKRSTSAKRSTAKSSSSSTSSSGGGSSSGSSSSSGTGSGSGSGGSDS